MDPREVGVDWLVLLLQNERFSDATKLQQLIEAERRKQYPQSVSDPRDRDTHRVFTAFTGLACYVYAGRLRRGADEGNDVEDGDETIEGASKLQKSVRFREPKVEEDYDDDVDFESRLFDATRLVSDREGRMARIESKAAQLDELAEKSFEEAVFHPGLVWDAFLPPYLAILSRKLDGEKCVLEALEKYRAAHPDNPNSHRFLMEHLSKEDLESERRHTAQRSKRQRFNALTESEKHALKESLIAFNKAAPSDKTHAFRLIDFHYLEADSEETMEKSRRSAAVILFNLLDNPEWRKDVECWRRLVEALVGDNNNDMDEDVSGTGSGAGSVGNQAESSVGSRAEVFLRGRALMKREWFESRADWWPKMHFSARQADDDVGCRDNKNLIKRKNAFAKIIKRLTRDKFFAEFKDADMADECFKNYGDRIKMILNRSSASVNS